MLNHIVLMGRLVRDPELRRTQSGVAVASFRLAVDRDFANQQTGEREADFIDIVAWRSTAEFVSKYFSKGRMAVVSGRLQMRNWTDNNGQKRISAEVVAENVYFGESKREGGGNGSSYAGSYNDYDAPPARGGPPSGGGYAGGYSAAATTGGYGSGAPGSQTPMAGDYALLEDDDSELPF